MSPTSPRTPSFTPRDAIEKHARFRQMCTSFFVDLVSTMCFKDNCPPHKDVVDALLSLLFVRKELLRDAPHSESLLSRVCPTPVRPRARGLTCPCPTRGHREHTKSLSPFDDVVDKTPVIRSVVLKLLLKYRSAGQGASPGGRFCS